MMEVHKLQSNIIANIRSSTTINSVTQCITELVLNSLDAKSTAIAVRINLVSFRIQVVDNGEGITKHNLNLIGQRYMTSKCNNLNQLESKLDYYGFRGEALASIVNNSKTVEIISKHKNSSETFSTCFRKATKNVVTYVRDRPSYGTTVTLEDYLYNFPLRKNRIIPEMELMHIKKNIECLIIIHPNVSFSLRNDVTGNLILNSRKCKDIISSFKYLHPEVNDEYSLIKVSKYNIMVKGLIFKGMFENNYLQYIYVNKRPVKCSKIQLFINDLLQKNKANTKGVYSLLTNETVKYPVYLINIKCPCSFVDILLSPTKTVVEFQNWDLLFSCIEKLIFSFIGKSDRSTKQNNITAYKPSKNDCGMSQINGMVKGFGFKRKYSSEERKSMPEKRQKLMGSQNGKLNNLIDVGQYTTHSQTPPADVSNEGKNKTTEKKVSHLQYENKNYKRDSINLVKNVKSGLFYKGETDAIDKVNKTNNQPNITQCVNIENNFQTFIGSPSCSLPAKFLYNERNYLENINLKKRDRPCMGSKPQESHKIDNYILKTCISTKLNNHTLPIEKSFRSKFTNDENKGKNLIMEMFLKSTQAYNSDTEEQSDKKSEDMVMEIESNYFLANNITTNINGKSKTMSVSVNITKRIKRKCKINKRRQMASKLIQTSLEKNNMISKHVQTSVQQKHKDYKGYSDDTKLAENCTIILSTAHKVPYFKFIHRSPFNLSYIVSKMPYQNNYQCNYKKNIKQLFNFDNNLDTMKYIYSNGLENHYTNFNNNDTVTCIGNPQTCCINELNLKDVKDIGTYYSTGRQIDNVFKHKPDGKFSKHTRKFKINEVAQRSLNQSLIYCNKSPYFLKEQNGSLSKSLFNTDDQNLCNMSSNMYGDYKYFNPQFQSTQMNYLYNNKSPPQKNILDNTLCSTRKKYFGRTCNFTPPKFFEIDRLDASTFSNLIQPSEFANNYNCDVGQIHKLLLNDINRDNSNDQSDKIIGSFALHNYRQNCDTRKQGNMVYCNPPIKPYQGVSEYQANKTTSDFTKLFITLSNRQKDEILKNEINTEKDMYNMNLEWQSQMKMYKEKQGNSQQKELEEFDREWMKKQNNFGNNFYINRKTGFTTFCTPKPLSNNFKLCERYEFIPKGLSPILKEINEVENSLSQSKKDKLEAYIMESYQNELLIIKWQHYIKSNDPKTFFEEVYTEKLNSFEQCIPRALQFKKYCSQLNSISFDKTLFNNISVIGQVDRKFIVVIEGTKHLLILFDQHAVHERIRLEELLKGYPNTKILTNQDKLMVSMPYNDLSLLEKHEKYLKSLGLHVEFFKDGINVMAIPSCLWDKFKDMDGFNSLNAIIQLLMKEITDLIKETGGVALKNLPKIIQNVLNLEACRGAVKFGDELTHADCELLLQKLAVCNLPFQCAHGRPTLTPLLSLNLTKPSVCLSYLVLTICH